ncbi:hypothetical protein YPPY13_3719 [Yersinia pestis PY-13]|uniref:Uncharacterized protein n=2 Tax=Yersinia pestis TaxID=632 RepID=A0AAV3BL72_YERPE|nr:hypothetical protein YPIP275_3705 [Yersinia pestis biovar Orientalis str. IP275]EDR38722.1 hypothetical protein YpF1991016_3182 [Yersinia pestis biovar Orientalis str. F1991016]EIQ85756.1 hypothetical protein YPPY01_3644 [Yersinia pestis PY-01]EIQ98975.1 hypothetical protein YPPY04_3697 [Yersinia pestis PY-04]EIQ99988.1 hypothetical protein YPPY05_3686 [Yersinia pestis PY-05]EIR03411.1 hypothetical protein YPPY06_3740 [Yersinia pestis PY-06]EIR14263.1 hypothetical protein YPPY07_3611 [Yers
MILSGLFYKIDIILFSIFELVCYFICWLVLFILSFFILISFFLLKTKSTGMTTVLA